MTLHRSEFLQLRGLRYHLNRWGAPDAPLVVLAHGWMDVGATFGPVAQALLPGLQVLAPDWRGFGRTQWAPAGYWFQDYVADLDQLVEQISPRGPVDLVGHSMGAQIVSLYAGLRPQRVRRLAILDGLFLPQGDPTTLPKRYRKWLDTVDDPHEVPAYDSYEELAGRVARRHPHLDPARCAFIARCWGAPGDDGRVRLLADPRHLIDSPRTYWQAESDVIWAQITAETLFIDGGRSVFAQSIPPEEKARRRALFRHHRETVIEDAGHMLHFEAPQALARNLAGFLTP